MTVTKAEKVKLSTLKLSITCMLVETTSHPLQVRRMEQGIFMMTLKGMRALFLYHRTVRWGDCVSAGLCQVRKVDVDYRKPTDQRLQKTRESLEQSDISKSMTRRRSR